MEARSFESHPGDESLPDPEQAGFMPKLDNLLISPGGDQDVLAPLFETSLVVHCSYAVYGQNRTPKDCISVRVGRRNAGM